MAWFGPSLTTRRSTVDTYRKSTQAVSAKTIQGRFDTDRQALQALSAYQRSTGEGKGLLVVRVVRYTRGGGNAHLGYAITTKSQLNRRGELEVTR